jgi:hypothetical protein
MAEMILSSLHSVPRWADSGFAKQNDSWTQKAELLSTLSPLSRWEAMGPLKALEQLEAVTGRRALRRSPRQTRTSSAERPSRGPLPSSGRPTKRISGLAVSASRHLALGTSPPGLIRGDGPNLSRPTSARARDHRQGVDGAGRRCPARALRESLRWVLACPLG